MLSSAEDKLKFIFILFVVGISVIGFALYFPLLAHPQIYKQGRILASEAVLTTVNRDGLPHSITGVYVSDRLGKGHIKYDVTVSTAGSSQPQIFRVDVIIADQGLFYNANLRVYDIAPIPADVAATSDIKPLL